MKKFMMMAAAALLCLSVSAQCPKKKCSGKCGNRTECCQRDSTCAGKCSTCKNKKKGKGTCKKNKKGNGTCKKDSTAMRPCCKQK